MLESALLRVFEIEMVNKLVKTNYSLYNPTLKFYR